VDHVRAQQLAVVRGDRHRFGHGAEPLARDAVEELQERSGFGRRDGGDTRHVVSPVRSVKKQTRPAGKT
jgi:hypothetical protein